MYETSNCIRFVYGQNTLVTTPLQTQIGLRGATIADFIALGDTSCNWAFGAPGSLVTTHFPVSLSCNMPPGFAFHFGGCPMGGAPVFAYMTGKVFNDLNNDCFANIIDKPVTDITRFPKKVPTPIIIRSGLLGDITNGHILVNIKYKIKSPMSNKSAPSTLGFILIL